MRLLVFGAAGELGTQICIAAPPDWEVRASTRVFADVTRLADMHREVRYFRPNVVINCAGVLRGDDAPDPEFVAVNALAPYNIADACEAYGAKLVQISTDCVFAGHRARWNMITDTPDAQDLYGRSKMLGEVRAPHVAVVRTSFIGPTSRLWRWLEGEAKAGKTNVPGWERASWSGSTSREVAEALIAAIETDVLPWGRVAQLATEAPISKRQAVQALVKHLGLPLIVEPVDWPHLNMALCPTLTIRPFGAAIEDL